MEIPKTRNVTDARWFSGYKCVGIVRVDDPYDGIMYFIGAGGGHTEEADVQCIARWGASFPKEIGDQLFGDF